MLRSVHSGVVALQLVQEEEDDTRCEAMLAEIDAGTVTPVPHGPSPTGKGHPMFDEVNSITLLTAVPDFRQTSYVSADDMLVDSWISPQAVQLRLPVALATLRSKKAAGSQVVTRERTIDSKLVLPHPSSYVRYRGSLPMVADPVFQDYLKECRTYKENTSLAMDCKPMLEGSARQVAALA